MTLTATEEDYLKAIYKLAEKDQSSVSTSSIAKRLSTSAASVTDMVQRLSEKDLVHYKKYYGVTLAAEGNRIATSLIRKHRLWEVFLVKKLKFKWNEIHDIAEELEHIKSDDLIIRLDNFLDNPKFDPHGDPIPNARGKFTLRTQYPLQDLGVGVSGILLGVKEHDDAFLDYLNTLGIKLGSHFQVVERLAYDSSLRVIIDHGDTVILGAHVCQSLLVRRT